MKRGPILLKAGAVVTPFEVLKDSGVVVDGDTIRNISDSTDEVLYSIDFGEDHIIFPAIINPHDHLLGSYWPKVGRDTPYYNWKEWDDDLKSAPVYSERSNISNFDLYLLGSYKNIFSGVATVHDHFPHELNEPYLDKLPLRAIKNYTLAHEVSSYELPWGRGVEEEHREAVENDWPFVTHIEEGFDEESLRGIDILIEKGALDEHTVLIHGIGFSDEDIKRVAEAGAHFVWCPMSNWFMFKKTARIKEIIEAGINASLGTDSPMSGSINILEEIKFAKNIYRMLYGEDIPSKTLVEMVTVNPAKAFRISSYTGSIEAGKKADLLVIKGDPENPYDSLVNAWFDEIVLVMLEGCPIYSYKEYEDLFEVCGIENREVFAVDNSIRIAKGKPLKLKERINLAVGFNKDLPFFPVNGAHSLEGFEEVG